MVIWTVLLALGLTFLVRSGHAPSLRLVLGGTLVGQLALHTVHGEEAFLYSLHWLPLLILLAGLATLGPARRMVLVLSGLLVVCAGTSDLPVAEEAAITAEMMGNEVVRIADVGVAGIHRLLHRLPDLRQARVLVVVAGMEGALPSVVAGLVDTPVIAVPTSVGYGASFGGLAALLGMLNSCAAGISVVNIDNGFGAGYMASLINHTGNRSAGSGSVPVINHHPASTER